MIHHAADLFKVCTYLCDVKLTLQKSYNMQSFWWKIEEFFKICPLPYLPVLILSRFASDFKLLIDTFISKLLCSTVQFQFVKILLAGYQTGYSTYFTQTILDLYILRL